ncbi:MAG: NUDIX domain-containing protein [Candidatus Daviesbacteria bacterium]|nr:NUDIX domain-containing protein [Candidatus Daviesbacteria bacterium]
MNDQVILAVDDNGKFLEYIPKEMGHKGLGRRHLAIAVLLQNPKGEVLLQKRKHRIFDNIWDITGATHPLLQQDGSNETLEEATWRCLKEEYGIKDKIPLKNLGFFNYFAPYHTIQGNFCENEAEPLFCENEHCAMIVGEYDGQIKMNPDMGYECKWMDKEKFLKDIEQNPKDYTPWAIKSLEFLKR